MQVLLYFSGNQITLKIAKEKIVCKDQFGVVIKKKTPRYAMEERRKAMRD
jgi:hypothetical protein